MIKGKHHCLLQLDPRTKILLLLVANILLFFGSSSEVLKKKSGTISFRGKQLSLKECRKLCAFVMQDVNHQLFSDSVWDECELSAPSESAAMIEALLKRFDLLGLKDSHPMALSGGQKQRLAVATAILSRKKYLFLMNPPVALIIVI